MEIRLNDLALRFKILISITAKKKKYFRYYLNPAVCVCVCFSVNLKSKYSKTNGDMNEILSAHKLTGQRKKIDRKCPYFFWMPVFLSDCLPG